MAFSTHVKFVQSSSKADVKNLDLMGQKDGTNDYDLWKAEEGWFVVTNFDYHAEAASDGAKGTASGEVNSTRGSFLKELGRASPVLLQLMGDRSEVNIMVQFGRPGESKGKGTVRAGAILFHNAKIVKIRHTTGDATYGSSPTNSASHGSDTKELERVEFVYQKADFDWDADRVRNEDKTTGSCSIGGTCA